MTAAYSEPSAQHMRSHPLLESFQSSIDVTFLEQLKKWKTAQGF